MRSKLFVLLALQMCLFSASAVSWADTPVAIAIHGGAGTILPENLSAAEEREIHAVLERALLTGHAQLTAGSSAEAAVSAAIVVLEDSPFFNAGRGAVFNHRGGHELDASIMRGSDRNAGAVTGVRHIANPILLAAKVMTDSRHVLLAGDGAEEFALQHKFDLVPNSVFDTPRRRQQLHDAQSSAERHWPVEFRFGTVGAVALDRNGDLAAGTSTGGMTNKRFGRIGDSPLIGAGTYADNATCAVSATGHGEYFMRAVVAHDIAAKMRYTGATVADAADTVINKELKNFGGNGGVIALDANGNIALVHNTPGMYRGYINVDGELKTAIFR